MQCDYQWENINHTAVLLSLIIEYLAGIPFISRKSWIRVNTTIMFVKVFHYSTNEHWKRTRSLHWFSSISFYSSTSCWFIAFAHIWNNFNNSVHDTVQKSEHKYLQHVWHKRNEAIEERSVSCFNISINPDFWLNMEKLKLENTSLWWKLCFHI